MFKITPPGCGFISGKTARVTRRMPSALLWNMVSQSASLPSSTRSTPCAPPALLTSTSTRPAVDPAQSANTSTLSVQVTSSLCTCAEAAPRPVHSAATSASRSSRRAPSNRFIPMPANCRAVSAPNPLEAPVTSAHFPSRRLVMRKAWPSTPRLAKRKQRLPEGYSRSTIRACRWTGKK